MNAGIVENCGKFERVAPAGFLCLKWPFESVVRTLSLKTQKLDVYCDTKTKDNVFVKIVIAVLYKVVEDKVPSAHYKLTDAQSQIKSYVFDVIRSSIPRLELDEAFASKDDVAHAVKSQLQSLMGEYGYSIIDVLVTDIEPAAEVRAAMCNINAQQRLREAAAYKAEAEKILQVKSAEADAESKYLSGLGVVSIFYII
jgi:regulator of protease activity HflC (stomatin/prohibitin superfamily)